jgi:Flp pilus assembly protein TadG
MPHLSPSCRPRRSAISKRARARAGATALEFAFVGPVFLMLILGIIEVGRGLMVQSLLTNAARAGARTGIIEGKGNTDITSAVATSLSGLGISGDAIAVQVNDGSADASSAQPNDEITVTVSVPVSSVSWVPVPNFLNGTIYGRYTLRRD